MAKSKRKETSGYAQRRERRAQFMNRLYEKVDASVSEFVSAFEIAQEIEMPNDEVVRTIEYLEEKRYLHIDDHKQGIIRITAAGIDHVEAGD